MRRFAHGWRTPTRRLPAKPRRTAVKSNGPTRPACPVGPITAAALPPEGTPRSSADRASAFSQSMISSLTNQGKLRFMIYEGAIKAPIFLNFLQRLVREAARKLFVIIDNLPVHRAHRVTAWVQNNADRIELVYLPPYAPEHNPDEFLNNDLKQAMARRRTPRDKVALKSSLTSYMRSLQRCPAQVRAFFQAPTVRYAA